MKKQIKYNFWIMFKVEGSERERTITTVANNKKQAKLNVCECFGNSVKVTFLDILKNHAVI